MAQTGIVAESAGTRFDALVNAFPFVFIVKWGQVRAERSLPFSVVKQPHLNGMMPLPLEPNESIGRPWADLRAIGRRGAPAGGAAAEPLVIADDRAACRQHTRKTG